MSFSSPQPTSVSTASGKTYRVGTLLYTRTVLLTVLFWMLLGDLCLSIMEATVPAIVPLQLRWAGASDSTIGLFTAGIPAILSILFTPLVGVQSDRCRTRLGRRRPFILWFTPPVVISLILLGHSEELSRLAWGILPWEQWHISFDNLRVGLIGLFASTFVIFNIYILSGYQYLFKDVIPEEVLGRFVGLYRAVGAIGGFIFNRYLFGSVETHLAAIYSGAAILYAAAFFLLAWRVKEGEYPPPEPRPQRKGLLSGAATYVRECFSHPFYLKIYTQGLCFWCAWVPFMTFIVFFSTSANKDGYAPTLGMSLADFGELKGWTMLLQVPVFFAAGWLADRFHPLRVLLAGGLIMSVTYLGGFLLIADGSSLLFWWMLNAVGCGLFLAAYMAMLTRLLPVEKYGQFFSANSVIFQTGLAIAPLLCGVLLDQFRDYRFIFAWSGFFALLGIGFGISLYRHWLRLGGDAHYQPPVTSAS